MNITVVGAGYVGLANAFLLAHAHNVVVYDIDPYRVDLLNKRLLPIRDADMEQEFSDAAVSICATTSAFAAFDKTDVVIVATPTDYDADRNRFDTRSIENVLGILQDINPNAVVAIRSTVPVGYTEDVSKKYNKNKILFVPEFLREGKALHDSYYPSRLVIGDTALDGKRFAALLQEGIKSESTPIVFMNSTEAEAVKLFANTYLAMRIAYFNELDSYAAIRGINTANIIKGVCLDSRIGEDYNNPSFGYGGYCLPKDSKQLLINFDGVPQNIISAVVAANHTRKKFIVGEIVSKQPKMVGIYRLIMKSGSDNFRESAIHDIIRDLLNLGIKCMIYEPTLRKNYNNSQVEIIEDLSDMKARCDVILANRWDNDLNDVREKVYTRDIFGRD